MADILTEREQALARMLQDDIPISPRPFAEIGESLGMTEDEVVAKVKAWLESGTIRRFGAMVRHQKLGYKANAMTAWDVPDGKAEEVGRILASASEVSHCYQRPRAEGWSYNLFAMIHAATPEECHQVAARLSEKIGIEDYELLFSSREFKKISMKYFIEQD
ncbi:MAG: Lrp/AsnC family transcriptional regulator [Thermoleophilia bacterium]|jgi:DNA-binding Lrp family transcriptional regulator